MAIWQIPVTVIPKESILNLFETIPSHLFVDDYTRREITRTISRTKRKELQLRFKDAFEYPWWEDLHLNKSILISEFDRIISKSRWDGTTYTSWKGDTSNSEDNDIALSSEEDSGQVTGLSFRADLRDSTSNFIGNMLDLCQKMNWLIMFRNGRLITPDPNLFKQNIPQSNAAKFLNNPEDFLKNFANQHKSAKAADKLKKELGLKGEDLVEQLQSRSYSDYLFPHK